MIHKFSVVQNFLTSTTGKSYFRYNFSDVLMHQAPTATTARVSPQLQGKAAAAAACQNIITRRSRQSDHGVFPNKIAM